MRYRMSVIYGHPVIAATRALRFSDHVTKRNGGSRDENGTTVSATGVERKLWKPDWAACFAPFSAVRQHVEIGYSITTTCQKITTTTYNNHHHERKSHVTIALTIALILSKLNRSQVSTKNQLIIHL